MIDGQKLAESIIFDCGEWDSQLQILKNTPANKLQLKELKGLCKRLKSSLDYYYVRLTCFILDRNMYSLLYTNYLNLSFIYDELEILYKSSIKELPLFKKGDTITNKAAVCLITGIDIKGKKYFVEYGNLVGEILFDVQDNWQISTDITLKKKK